MPTNSVTKNSCQRGNDHGDTITILPQPDQSLPEGPEEATMDITHIFLVSGY
jgi:hypothetical protein